MSVAARTQLAAQQAAVVTALVSNGIVPDGFDAQRLHVAAESLLRKRCRAAAQAWPSLARDLGSGFRERFANFAATTPLPSLGGPLADGREFADWLGKQGPLSEAAELQRLAVDLRFARTAAGLKPRRTATIQLAWLSQPRRVVIALRWPRFGERWFTIRLGR